MWKHTAKFWKLDRQAIYYYNPLDIVSPVDNGAEHTWTSYYRAGVLKGRGGKYTVHIDKVLQILNYLVWDIFVIRLSA